MFSSCRSSGNKKTSPLSPFHTTTWQTLTCPNGWIWRHAKHASSKMASSRMKAWSGGGWRNISPGRQVVQHCCATTVCFRIDMLEDRKRLCQDVKPGGREDACSSACQRRLCNTASQLRHLFRQYAYMPESPPRLGTVQCLGISPSWPGWQQPTNQNVHA